MYSMSEVVDSICGRINFLGEYNSKTDYDIGDVVLKEGKPWICTRTFPHEWNYLGEVSDIHEASKSMEVEISYQCRNCGAPTDEGGYCRYCGTINRKERKFNI